VRTNIIDKTRENRREASIWWCESRFDLFFVSLSLFSKMTSSSVSFANVYIYFRWLSVLLSFVPNTIKIKGFCLTATRGVKLRHLGPARHWLHQSHLMDTKSELRLCQVSCLTSDALPAVMKVEKMTKSTRWRLMNLHSHCKKNLR